MSIHILRLLIYRLIFWRIQWTYKMLRLPLDLINYLPRSCKSTRMIFLLGQPINKPLQFKVWTVESHVSDGDISSGKKLGFQKLLEREKAGQGYPEVVHYAGKSSLHSSQSSPALLQQQAASPGAIQQDSKHSSLGSVRLEVLGARSRASNGPIQALLYASLLGSPVGVHTCKAIQ